MKRIFLAILMLLVLALPSAFADNTLWGGFTIDAGLPYVRTSVPFIHDFITNFNLGFTPIKVGSKESLGFMVRFSIGTDFGPMGKNTYRNVPIGMWCITTPMISSYYEIDKDSFLITAVGYGFLNQSDHLLLIDGLIPAWNMQYISNGFIIEIGLEGPDFYAGLGASF